MFVYLIVLQNTKIMYEVNQLISFLLPVMGSYINTFITAKVTTVFFFTFTINVFLMILSGWGLSWKKVKSHISVHKSEFINV